MTAEGADKVPDGQDAVWFGDPNRKRISEGSQGDTPPVVGTMSLDRFVSANRPVFRH
jgi:hypothetical protein